jgi:hypothetical protein
MPKNPVTDPITDQEIAFVHLIVSGSMNDQRAAEAVGLNPSTAAYTKSKPRVRDHMIKLRAAVEEKLINQEAEGLRNLHFGRDQVLARLWHLANLAPEATRGSMAGQIKALSMIIAIAGLIPNRGPGRFNAGRLAPVPTQPASPPAEPSFSDAEWMRQQSQVESAEPGQSVTAAKAKPAAPQVPKPPLPSRPTEVAPSPNLNRNQTGILNPFVYPEAVDRVLAAMGPTFDADINTTGSFNLLIPTLKDAFPRGR